MFRSVGEQCWRSKMSIIIYTYHDPYKIDQEPYWNEIKNCPYFCSAQTLVNGLRTHYKGKFDGGRVTTVKMLTDALYEEWSSPAWIVKQHTDIDNIINGGLPTTLTETERKNIGKSFLFNRDAVFESIRTMFELNVDINAILREKLTKEQKYILSIYEKILTSDKKEDFFLAKSLSEEEINIGLQKVMTAIQKDYDSSDVDTSNIVIHGVHQFTPIILRAIDELQKYKNVILMFNYQKQYKNVYQTWFDIYSAFDCKIVDYDQVEFTPTDILSVSYKGNVLADQIGKLVNGQKKSITVDSSYEIMEFDNMTEFAGYVADIFEEADHKDPSNPMSCMREQIYAANTSVNDILKIYFPEQFGERQFLNYPIGHFFVAIANMWDPENNEILITDINDIRECLCANILEESTPGELMSIFGRIQVLFDGCTSIVGMRKRLRSLKKNMKYITDSDEEEYLSHISYYAVSKNEIEKIDSALEDLEDIAAHFYEDFENKTHNFREFYRKLRNYLQTDILEDRELSDEFADILKRVLLRLEEVENIDASASFECLKSTMSIYLLQETKPGRSANWIVRNFEQIDGDILRSGHENPNIIYHFACLEDEDVGVANRVAFPWPLNDAFFEVAQNPVDWKYQVYVKCCNEYRNFKRYALIYGLEFNRAKFKLSYVKRDGDKEREPYYLLKILGLKKKKYSSTKVSKGLEDSAKIKIQSGGADTFSLYDYYRFRICKYRFLTETLIEKNTVYKDNFLLLKYMEVMLENAIKEDMQGNPISEAILIQKLDDEYDELKKYFPFARNVNRMDVINNIRNRLVNGKAKKFSVLSAEDRRHMMIREIFIHKKLENAKNVGVDIMQDKFPNVTFEQIKTELSEEKLKKMDYAVNVNVWCQFCSNRELCTAYYCRSKE